MAQPYATALCHSLMSEPYVTALCQSLMAQPYVRALCHSLMSQPYVRALCQSLMSQPYVTAARAAHRGRSPRSKLENAPVGHRRRRVWPCMRGQVVGGKPSFAEWGRPVTGRRFGFLAALVHGGTARACACLCGTSLCACLCTRLLGHLCARACVHGRFSEH